MRRILLSSLPGAAVNSVHIDGVLHEFPRFLVCLRMLRKIILNLKGLSLKIHSDEEKILEIDAEGEGKIVAGDIRADSDVEF